MKRKKRSDRETVIPLREDPRVGEIAISMAGHDAGLILVVIAGIDGQHVLAADGRTRKLMFPKKKKMRHLNVIARLSEEDVRLLRAGKINDSFLRRKISSLNLETLAQS